MIEIVLPLALGIVMFGLGLSLSVADFRRAAKHPRVVLVALLCQVVILPLLCLALVMVSGLEDSGDAGPYLAAGMLLLAASPGGATATLFSHLFRGDVALNVTLLAINSVLSILTLPLIVNLALDHFLGGSDEIGLQVADTLKVFVIVLVPIAIGMSVRRARPAWAERMDRSVRVASVAILVGVVAAVVAQKGDEIWPYLDQVAAVVIIFCLLNLSLGYLVPRTVRVSRPQSIAVSMEIGVHNETLAITIALSVLETELLAVAPAVYALLKFAIIPIFGALVFRGARAEVNRIVYVETGPEPRYTRPPGP